MSLIPRDTPCPSCPYRQSCPSGVWDSSEYLKLVEYDKETGEQPVSVFMCHDARDDKTLCRGWLDTHEKFHLLSLRLAVGFQKVDKSIFDLPTSGVPVFESGRRAALHGMQEINTPSAKAIRVIEKLENRRATDETDD